MTSRVPIRLPIMFRSPLAICQPIYRVILVHILGVCRHEFQRLRPKCWNRLGRIVKVYGKAVGLVVILHITEYVIVDVAEEMDLGFHPPIVTGIRQSWMFVEHAAIPTAHLMVGFKIRILNVLFLKDGSRLLKKVLVYPAWYGPVVFGDEFWGTK